MEETGTSSSVSSFLAPSKARDVPSKDEEDPFEFGPASRAYFEASRAYDPPSETRYSDGGYGFSDGYNFRSDFVDYRGDEYRGFINHGGAPRYEERFDSRGFVGRSQPPPIQHLGPPPLTSHMGVHPSMAGPPRGYGIPPPGYHPASHGFYMGMHPDMGMMNPEAPGFFNPPSHSHPRYAMGPSGPPLARPMHMPPRYAPPPAMATMRFSEDAEAPPSWVHPRSMPHGPTRGGRGPRL